VTMTMDSRLSLECMSLMLSEGGWKTVWKKLALNAEKETLRSPYQMRFDWAPGWIDADSTPLKLDERPHYALVYSNLLIDRHALHCYFIKPAELNPYGGLAYPEDSTLVPMRARAEDFIGAGHEGDNIVATFKRLYLTHSDAEMAVKDCLEGRRKREQQLDPREMHRQMIAGFPQLDAFQKGINAHQQFGNIFGLNPGPGAIQQLQQSQQQQTSQLLSQQLDFAQQRMNQPMTATEVLQSSPDGGRRSLQHFTNKLLRDNPLQAGETLELEKDQSAGIFRFSAVSRSYSGHHTYRQLGGVSFLYIAQGRG